MICYIWALVAINLACCAKFPYIPLFRFWFSSTVSNKTRSTYLFSILSFLHSISTHFNRVKRLFLKILKYSHSQPNLIFTLELNLFLSKVFTLYYVSCSFLFSFMAFCFARSQCFLNKQTNKKGKKQNISAILFQISLWSILFCLFVCLNYLHLKIKSERCVII